MTNDLSVGEQAAVVLEASRAPSVYNMQPARWRFADDGSVILFRAVNRRIPVADPTGHNLNASLGAAFEGMAIALSTRGLSLGAPIVETEAAATSCEPVMRASIERIPGFEADPLAEFVARRRSYRGLFPTADPADVRRFVALERPDARLIIGKGPLADLGTLHDAAMWTLVSRPEFRAERWKWIRLSRSDPRFRRDGLTGDCLGASMTERWVLSPDQFSLFAAVGLARRFASEAAKVRSAGAAIVFCPKRDDAPFDVGRRMYRLWLEITAMGFHVATMSASVNDESARETLEHQLQLPSDRRIANVFRVGRIDDAKVAESPRLQVKELMV
ncbi:MAG: hypothetical protein ABJE10_11025 [bacterium]